MELVSQVVKLVMPEACMMQVIIPIMGIHRVRMMEANLMGQQEYTQNVFCIVQANTQLITRDIKTWRALYLHCRADHVRMFVIVSHWDIMLMVLCLSQKHNILAKVPNLACGVEHQDTCVLNSQATHINDIHLPLESDLWCMAADSQLRVLQCIFILTWLQQLAPTCPCLHVQKASKAIMISQDTVKHTSRLGLAVQCPYKIFSSMNHRWWGPKFLEPQQAHDMWCASSESANAYTVSDFQTPKHIASAASDRESCIHIYMHDLYIYRPYMGLGCKCIISSDFASQDCFHHNLTGTHMVNT